LQGVKNGCKKHPKLKLLDQNYIVTNWNPADAQKAVSGLIAKYPKIDWICSDYGVTTAAAVKAFKQAGLPVPAQATNASNNELNLLYMNDKKAGNSWQYFTLDGTTGVVRFAFRRAVSIFQGTPNNEPLKVLPVVFADSLQGIDPKVDPLAPPDADLSTTLPRSILDKILKR
jgi:ribose transport system substrate-binding protein